MTIKVTVWNEYLHEIQFKEIAAIYPKGIHGCIAEFLEKAGMEVLAIYDAFTYNKPKPDSERVYFVAREHGKKTV